LADRTLAQHRRALQVSARVGLGSGRVAEHGRVDVRSPAPRRATRAQSAVRRTRCERQPRHGLKARPRSGTGRNRRSRRRLGRASPGLRVADSKTRECQRERAARSKLAMSPVSVIVPSVGESISEGILSRWYKADGSLVKSGEPLFELETDKATSDVPAAGSGVLRIAVKEGETVAVGATVATIDPADSSAPAKKEKGQAPAAPKEPPNKPADETPRPAP